MLAPMSSPLLHPLCVHPLAIAGAASGIRIDAGFSRDDACLRLVYRVRGSLDVLHVPGPQDSFPGERLWEHTCFEAFVGGAGERYSEFNVSPNGQWARFEFEAYRRRIGTRTGQGEPVAVKVRRRGLELLVEASLAAELLPTGATLPVQVGLSAVLQGVDGSLTYFALAHAGPQPDFHDRQGWCCQLGPTAMARTFT
jgi:hypothetical protein